MADQHQPFIPRVDSPGVVEQLNSINPKVNRKKEDARRSPGHRRRRPSVEQLLEEEREQQALNDDGHIDIRA
jgi:hypothetical protein